MTDKELLEESLDAMLAAIESGDWRVDGACDPDWVIEAIKARLAQPELEYKECRHCGFEYKPNKNQSKKWYPLDNGLTEEQTNETMSVKGLIK